MLETVKIRPPGLVQGYHLSIDNSVVGKITERFCDLREAFVEVLAVAQIQDGYAARSDATCAVAVQLKLRRSNRSPRGGSEPGRNPLAR